MYVVYGNRPEFRNPRNVQNVLWNLQILLSNFQSYFFCNFFYFVAGGRRAFDKVTAANSNHGKYFTSVDYTADGTCVVAAGHSKFVCIYECSQQILVKKFQVNHAQLLRGVDERLSSCPHR